MADQDDGPVPGCRSSDSEVEFNANAGTTYLIAIDAKGAPSGAFHLTVEGVAANDDFGKPWPLGGRISGRGSASNRFATLQPDEPDHAGDPGGHSVWFKWTSPHNGQVSVDTCDSDIDTVLAVYTGSSLAGLTTVQSNDDGTGKCAPRSKLVFGAVANTVYRIAVDGKGGARGPIDLSVEAPPVNDEFGNAGKVPKRIPTYVPGSSLLATKEAGEPNHAGDPGGHSVWYSWTPSRSSKVAVTACADTFDPVLAIYTGAALGHLASVPTADTGSDECGEDSGLVFTAVAGTTYRLAVDGVGGDNGRFDLLWEPVASNPRSLSVERTGVGSGFVTSGPTGIACGAVCSYEFEMGTEVTLHAHSDSGSTFAGWAGGGCAGTGPCQVTLNTDTTVVANFQIASSGNGGSEGVPPVSAPTVPPSMLVSPPKPKPPLRCKAGFKKVRLGGKLKCVKKKKVRRGGGGGGRGKGHRG